LPIARPVGKSVIYFLLPTCLKKKRYLYYKTSKKNPNPSTEKSLLFSSKSNSLWLHVLRVAIKTLKRREVV